MLPTAPAGTSSPIAPSPRPVAKNALLIDGINNVALDVLAYRVKQAFFARKMMIQRSTRYAGAPDDLFGRCLRVATLRKQLTADPDQAANHRFALGGFA